MGILFLLLLPVAGPFKGFMALARRITEEAEASFYNEAGIRAALLELEMQLQDGAIAELEFARAEEQLMARLTEAAQRREAREHAGGG